MSQANRLHKALVLLLLWAFTQSTNLAAQPAWESFPHALPDLQGKTHRLQDWKGKLILLNYWASWCAPCQHEIRRLVLWQTRHGKQGLQVVGVGLDDPNKLANVALALDINYPVLVANPSDNRYLRVWGNQTGAIPFSVLINAQGQVLGRFTGILTSDDFTDLILPHL